jgi:hypothetical protein|tara:strand:+ start:133 stop:555 length:423 start_codon:yes stop_codon:yes gene_type:complete
MINLKKLLNETFLGGGDLPSSKLIKMKQTLAETMADDSDDSISEGDGLWANIRAKKARGEKPAHKNSKAHKDAVKAGDKINKDESVSEGTGDMDRMQEISADFSMFIKNNLPKVKRLPTDKQKAFGKMIGDFKDGLDELV